MTEGVCSPKLFKLEKNLLSRIGNKITKKPKKPKKTLKTKGQEKKIPERSRQTIKKKYRIDP
jgi:hypothetical protein